MMISLEKHKAHSRLLPIPHTVSPKPFC